VRRGGVIGRGEATTGTAPFGRLVAQVMAAAPDRSPRRVVWVTANGSSLRGETAAAELAQQHPHLILVHLPVHASWLNQSERSCSILPRQVLPPNDFADLAALEQRLTAFAARYTDTAVPFDWRFTRAKLEARLADLATVPPPATPIRAAA
jgi:hypothetical protein